MPPALPPVPGSGPAPGSAQAWTHRRFFELVSKVSPLRIISRSGASTFEALVRLERFSIDSGYMNAMQPDFHWHLALKGLGFVRSRDEIHRRSGRRVMFFELAEQADAPPFLLIYVYRPKDAEFTPTQEQLFAEAHGELGAGCRLETER